LTRGRLESSTTRKLPSEAVEVEFELSLLPLLLLLFSWIGDSTVEPFADVSRELINPE
jgi:hypothetical protein